MFERRYQSKVLKQSEPPKEKRPFNWKRFFIIIANVVILIAIVYVIRLPALQVHSVEVIGTDVADPQEISLFVENEIQGKYLFILPKKSMLLVPTKTLTKKVSTAFPRFASVDIRRTGIDSLTVTVQEHTGAYLWCNAECFFMNSEGVVYAIAPTFSGDAYLKLYGGEENQLPFRPLTKNNLYTVTLLQNRLPYLDIKPVKIKFLPDNTLTVVFLDDTREVELIFNGESIEPALEALYTAFRTDAFVRQYRDSSKVLRYIDLRYPNKVVYKFDQI